MHPPLRCVNIVFSEAACTYIEIPNMMNCCQTHYLLRSTKYVTITRLTGSTHAQYQILIGCVQSMSYMDLSSISYIQICWLLMRRECRERFPLHPLQRRPLVSKPGMHHGMCVTHVRWCMSGSLTRGGGENFPAYPANALPAILRIWSEVRNACTDLSCFVLSSSTLTSGFMQYLSPYNSDKSTAFVKIVTSTLLWLPQLPIYVYFRPKLHLRLSHIFNSTHFKTRNCEQDYILFMVLRKSITWILPFVINWMCGWLIEETYAIILYIIRSGRSIRQWSHDLFRAGKAICIYEQKSSAIMQMPSAWLLWRSLSLVWYFCGINYLEKWQSTWLPWPLLAYSDCATATDQQHRKSCVICIMNIFRVDSKAQVIFNSEVSFEQWLIKSELN